MNGQKPEKFCTKVQEHKAKQTIFDIGSDEAPKITERITWCKEKMLQK